MVKDVLYNKIAKGTKLEREIIAKLFVQFEDINDIIAYLKNVTIYGCASGMVEHLIDYSDTEKFFIKHHKEIFEIFNKLSNTYFQSSLKELNSNDLAWFGYEQTCYNILNELGIDF